MAVEVGARGVVANSLIKAAAIGTRGRAQKNLDRDVGTEACHCSKCLYWLMEGTDWSKGVSVLVFEWLMLNQLK